MTSKIKHSQVVKKGYRVSIVGSWFKAKGYNLYLVDLNVPMFDLVIILSFGKMEEFSRYLRDRYDYVMDNINHTDAMFVSNLENKVQNALANHLNITSNEWRAKDYGTICHELHHAVHSTLTNRGVDYGKGGEEVFKRKRHAKKK